MGAGVVSGTQGSLQSLFQTLSFALGLILSRPSQFKWLMEGSCICVLLAASLYTLFARRVTPRTRENQ